MITRRKDDMHLPLTFKSIWISDIHLGSRGCSSNELLSFFRNTQSDNLFLVGDIIDFWQLKRKMFWPKSHNDVIQKILRISRKGTNVVYIPGNHDSPVRSYIPFSMGEIQIVDEYVYTSVNGKKFLVTHGDYYDIITTYHSWVAKLGDVGYNILIGLNRYINAVRSRLNLPYWSLSKYVKTKVKNAANFINKYEETLVDICERKKLDGVIAGHIHHADIRQIRNCLYMNDGDFVESKTALVETFEGTFKILEWRNNKLLEISLINHLGVIKVHKKPIVLLEEL